MLLHKNQLHNNAKLFKHTLTNEITAYFPPGNCPVFIFASTLNAKTHCVQLPCHTSYDKPHTQGY
jgi:hypothetical protein